MGKSVLITGGSKGIGRAIALRFAEPGAEIFLSYHADHDTATATAEEVVAKGGQPYLLPMDLSRPEAAQELIDAVKEQTASLDVLVHGAVAGGPISLLSVDLSYFESKLWLNGACLLALIQGAIEIMPEGSLICFLSSHGSQRVVPKYGALGPAKALGETLLRYLAYELQPRGIRANILAPGPIDTEALRSVFGDDGAERRLESAQKVLGGARLEATDVANVVAFLATDSARFVQGERIVIDGGLTLC